MYMYSKSKLSDGFKLGHRKLRKRWGNLAWSLIKYPFVLENCEKQAADGGCSSSTAAVCS